MGSGHSVFQVLSGDGLIRIPLLHLTAEDQGKTTQKWRAPQVPTGPKALRPHPQALSLGNTVFCLPWPQAAWGWLRGVQVRCGRPQKNCPERVAEGRRRSPSRALQ